MIESGEIKVDEADHLQELYIIKLKDGICMLETNVNNISEENKSHADLKIETKGHDIRKEIKYNSIRIISVQSKSVKGHAEKMQ